MLQETCGLGPLTSPPDRLFPLHLNFFSMGAMGSRMEIYLLQGIKLSLLSICNISWLFLVVRLSTLGGGCFIENIFLLATVVYKGRMRAGNLKTIISMSCCCIFTNQTFLFSVVHFSVEGRHWEKEKWCLVQSNTF